MPPKPSTRYVAPPGPETDCQPGSRGRVLCNLLGVTKKRVMDQMEFEALLRAQLEYAENRIFTDTRFTADLLRQMHRDWLGGLYAWAGRYRSVNLSKGGFLWPPAHLVPSHMEAFEVTLLRQRTPCRGCSPEEAVKRMAEVHGELLLIHPFREGNGRLARWLADLMALQANLPAPDYGLAGRDSTSRKERYLAAVRRAYVRDYRRLIDFFAEAVERALRAAGAGR